jgi:hypothetical protein
MIQRSSGTAIRNVGQAVPKFKGGRSRRNYAIVRHRHGRPWRPRSRSRIDKGPRLADRISGSAAEPRFVPEGGKRMKWLLAAAVSAATLISAEVAVAQDKLTVWWVKGFY